MSPCVTNIPVFYSYMLTNMHERKNIKKMLKNKKDEIFSFLYPGKKYNKLKEYKNIWEKEKYILI